MKKISILICLAAFSISLNAQGPSEALRVSQLSYEGSARTLAMGNAFTALGGDIGGIAVNPAASGVLHHSEFALSPGGIFASGGGECLGTPARNNAGRFVMNNAGISLAFGTDRLSGLLNYNFSIAVNRVADFNSTSAFSCTTGQSSLLGYLASDIAGVEETDLSWTDLYNPYFESPIPWNALLAYDTYLIGPRATGNKEYVGSTENLSPGRTVGGSLHQNYFSRSTGGIMQYAINFGFNVSDKVFFGFNLNFHSVHYTKDETYSETADRTSAFEDGFRSFSCRYWQTTAGTGFNGKFGIIVTPVGGLRLGATITTPTVYRLFDTWGRNMSSDFSSGEDRYGNRHLSRNVSSPEGAIRYRIDAPMQWSVGAAYTFGNFALLSVDYERVNCAAARLSDNSGNSTEFKYENDIISRGLTACNIFRAGAEVRPLEPLSIRAGYNRQSSVGTIGDYVYPDLNYISGGAGIRFGSDLRCSFDIAYQHLLRAADNYTMYSDYEADGQYFTAPRVNGWNSKGKLVFTFTYRF